MTLQVVVALERLVTVRAREAPQLIVHGRDVALEVGPARESRGAVVVATRERSFAGVDEHVPVGCGCVGELGAAGNAD